MATHPVVGAMLLRDAQEGVEGGLGAWGKKGVQG